jgi:hypothetical protein
MNTLLKATAALALALTVSQPAVAQTAPDAASCSASWNKMDAKKMGYVMSADSKEQMDMMSKAGIPTAAADRMTNKEYMDACMAKAFETFKK